MPDREEELVEFLRKKFDGKPVRCMAISMRTGERCKKLSSGPDTEYCGHHRNTRKDTR